MIPPACYRAGAPMNKGDMQTPQVVFLAVADPGRWRSLMPTVSWSAPSCPEPRYTKLPDALLSLTPRQHQLIHALLSYRWYADSAIYPSVPTLARRLAWSVRTVQRVMRQLEAAGYVVVHATYRADDGQGTNLYEPGPALLPYLPPAPARPVTGGVTPMPLAPVSPLADERDVYGNRTITSRRFQPGQRPPRREVDYTGGALGAYVRT